MATQNIVGLPIPFGIKSPNKMANADSYYGPYNSIQDALDTVVPAIRTIGKTVGIITNGQVEEFWFKQGVEDADLITKSVIYPVFTKTENGVVPAPTGKTSTRYLREDGTWVVPTDTTYTAGTLGALVTGTSTTDQLWSAKILADYFIPLRGTARNKYASGDINIEDIWTTRYHDGSAIRSVGKEFLEESVISMDTEDEVGHYTKTIEPYSQSEVHTIGSIILEKKVHPAKGNTVEVRDDGNIQKSKITTNVTEAKLETTSVDNKAVSNTYVFKTNDTGIIATSKKGANLEEAYMGYQDSDVVTMKRFRNMPYSITWNTPAIQFNNLPDKSTDATYNLFMGMDSNGNIAKFENAYNMLHKSFSTMTPAQKVALFSLMNGQYSTGQITTSIVIDPIIAKENRTSGTTQVKIIGTNLSINPETSYVRIKEVGNLTNFSDCTFTNSSSTLLHVDIPLVFIEENKSYVFEIKHGLQVHTTNSSISVVNLFEEINVNSLVYTKQVRNINGVLGDTYTDATLEGQTIVHRNKTDANTTQFDNSLAVKFYTNKIFEYTDDFIVIIDFNIEDYHTGGFDFPRTYDYVGLAKTQSDYSAVVNNLVAGSATGYKNFNNQHRRQAIFGATNLQIAKTGAGQTIIVKKGNRLTTILYMNGSVLYYTSNATSYDNGYSLEFNFYGRRVGARDISSFTVASLQKVVSSSSTQTRT